MSLVDAAAALDRLIGRPLGGGGLNQLPSPHTTARNDFRSYNQKPAHYPQLHCPITGSLPQLGHSPIYQKYFHDNEHDIPKCSTPLESLAPPLPQFAQHWGYPLDHQDVHQTVSMAADSDVLSPTQSSVPAVTLAAAISQAQVSVSAVFPVNDKLGSPLQQFRGSTQVSPTEVKGRSKLPHGLNERVESDEFVPLDPEKYKTELCRSFQVHGSCKYSFRCNYAHGLGQLRSPSRHGKYKTRNCQSYHRTGFCRYGARCSFIHDPEEGVLRCSIANKEVLEALHYHPEDESRIANITWRLSDDPLMNQPATLHFIKSHTPLDENLDNSSVCFETRETGIGNMLPLTWTQPIENKSDIDFSTSTESIKVFRKAYSNLNSKNENDSHFPFSKDGMSKEMQTNDDFVLNSLRLLDELAAAHPLLEDCQHSQTAKIEELTDGLAVPKVLDTLEESHSLQCLDVVTDILRNAPNYSSSVWSVAADDMTPPLAESQNKEITNITDSNLNELAIYTKSKEDFNSTFGNELFDDAVYALACSTLRSDYDDEPIEKNTSRKSSGDLNLADLIESLRVHEERQLARRPLSCQSQDSSDLSPDSPLSTDDTRLFDLTKYKTELCRSFQYNGFCKYGDACLYAHGGVDLRMYPKHPMYRTKKCFSFHNKGYCLYGSRCQFLHDSE